MAANTLTDEHRASLLEWLCEGASDGEIIARLESEHGVTCTAQNLTHYRDKWRDEIDEAEQRKMEVAKRRGWGLVSKRVAVLCKLLDKFEATLEYASAGQITQGKLGQEYRETLAELRRELGQDKPQRMELTGAGGGPVQTQVVTPEQLALAAAREAEDHGSSSDGD